MSREARRWRIGGQVQGVGFRPFVFRTAQTLGLDGWVQNRTGEVVIEASAPAPALDRFADQLLRAHPPLARPRIVETTTIETDFDAGFTIRPSNASGTPQIHLPPDFFTCDDCLEELHDPSARRYRYPFINCTQCGPRYTLIRGLPYDRPETAMAEFTLCPACRAEYEDPADRRFHAQPLACADCGPKLTWRQGRNEVADNEPALAACVQALRAGAIVAAKGVGGYHLLCDARNQEAVARLRARKHRPDKPLAVLFPWAGEDGLDALRLHAVPDTVEAATLAAPERPIVLVRLKRDHGLAPAIAPGLNEVGAMLPYSPLHHLLSADFDGPLVATSANLSGEPVLIEAGEIEQRLASIADGYLHHDRPILRPADDSVSRVIAGKPRRLRIGRGQAPLELDLPRAMSRPTLAVGGHMKNTVALAWDDRVVVSPHIGELDSPRSQAVFAQVIDDLCRLYRVTPARIVHDAHPGYASTRWALEHAQGHRLQTLAVFHHHAHAAIPAGEHLGDMPWLVFTWDGTGYGENGAIWGGETLLGSPGHWRRVASLRPFRLPGGDKAGREPWRSAAALSWELDQHWRPADLDVELAHEAWQRGLNTPTSSAAGRLFDACATLAGLPAATSFEAQAPMLWETLAGQATVENVAPLPLYEDDGLVMVDWARLVEPAAAKATTAAQQSAYMHATLAVTLVALAQRLREAHGEFRVGLSGGVFINRVLTESLMAQLAAAGFDVQLPHTVPYNDAGLSYGQIIEALYTP